LESPTPRRETVFTVHYPHDVGSKADASWCYGSPFRPHVISAPHQKSSAFISLKNPHQHSSQVRWRSTLTVFSTAVPYSIHKHKAILSLYFLPVTFSLIALKPRSPAVPKSTKCSLCHAAQSSWIYNQFHQFEWLTWLIITHNMHNQIHLKICCWKMNIDQIPSPNYLEVADKNHNITFHRPNIMTMRSVSSFMIMSSGRCHDHLDSLHSLTSETQSSTKQRPLFLAAWLSSSNLTGVAWLAWHDWLGRNQRLRSKWISWLLHPQRKDTLNWISVDCVTHPAYCPYQNKIPAGCTTASCLG
jgi:hypothetical protein